MCLLKSAFPDGRVTCYYRKDIVMGIWQSANSPIAGPLRNLELPGKPSGSGSCNAFIPVSRPTRACETATVRDSRSYECSSIAGKMYRFCGNRLNQPRNVSSSGSDSRSRSPVLKQRNCNVPRRIWVKYAGWRSNWSSRRGWPGWLRWRMSESRANFGKQARQRILGQIRWTNLEGIQLSGKHLLQGGNQIESPAPKIVPERKKCITCEETKPSTEFSKHSS